MYSKIILPKKSENVHWTNKILTKVLSNPCSDRHKSCRWYNKWNVSYYVHASLLVAIVWVSQYFLLGNKQCYVLTWQDLVVPLTDAALTFWSNFLQVVRLIFWYIDFFHNEIYVHVLGCHPYETSLLSMHLFVWLSLESKYDTSCLGWSYNLLMCFFQHDYSQ